MYPAPSTPPEPAPPDHHLLTPSSILRQLKENAAVSHSQSSLEEINCKNKKSNLSFQEFTLLIKQTSYASCWREWI